MFTLTGSKLTVMLVNLLINANNRAVGICFFRLMNIISKHSIKSIVFSALPTWVDQWEHDEMWHFDHSRLRALTYVYRTWVWCCRELCRTSLDRWSKLHLDQRAQWIWSWCSGVWSGRSVAEVVKVKIGRVSSTFPYQFKVGSISTYIWFDQRVHELDQVVEKVEIDQMSEPCKRTLE